ncbi:type II CAAX endopeptidase family protein [Oscillibacter sp.]|uniref:CPBP family intramembrane glutamic endopeptidase n=1 Tax=Oscillibacter sp. TaxID=1945593 RepID=UPI00260561F5|nr:type II CAAX endopeptidase family protein [Oscillibacter sp.]MDD3347782.1 type II CAAX endopeptidase family protein [Oscillibacter sp.]
MAKRKFTTYMTPGEQIAGVIFFVIYLLVLPFATSPLFRLAARLLGVTISPALQNAIYYYVLFAVTVIIFHGFLGRTTRHLADHLGGACRTFLVGLIALYGLNELVYRLTRLLVGNHTNLNDTAISAQIDTAPHMTLLIVVFLAPFVEEVLFRGLVFGNLKEKSRLVAYVVSCLLFALLHVWQFAVVKQDATYFLLMIQYLVPGLVLAWVYEHSGTLWTAVALHAATNALSVWGILG